MAIPDFDPERELGLFGVFDGHGGAAVRWAALLSRSADHGRGLLGQVAKVATERFPETLRALPAFKQVPGRLARQCDAALSS